MTRRDKVQVFGYEFKCTRDIGWDSWESKTCGDVCKGEVDDLVRVAHVPVVNVDE